MLELSGRKLYDFSGIELKWHWLLLAVAVFVAAVVAVIVIAALVQKKRGRPIEFTTKDITYGAMCVAIAYALSFFGYEMPRGGTITPAAILPIIIYCYYFGFVKGSCITIVYTILQLFQNPYIMSPFSAVLDYLVPYMALCLTGVISYRHQRYIKALNKLKIAEDEDNLFKKRRGFLFAAHYPVYIGCFCYIIIRYASHVLSGVLFYKEWAWADYSLLGYSLAYNSFVLVDFALAMVALTALLSSKSFNAFMASHGNTLKKADTATENNQGA